ncbi:MAG: hypothetical protein ACLUD0_12770 [Eubacterium ramulus]
MKKRPCSQFPDTTKKNGQKNLRHDFPVFHVLTDERWHIYTRGALTAGGSDLGSRTGGRSETSACTGLPQRDGFLCRELGYKEILSWLEGEISYEEAVYLLKRDTRHFAKRQLTWFRRERDVIWLNKPDYDYDDSRILDDILKNITAGGWL